MTSALSLATSVPDPMALHIRLTWGRGVIDAIADHRDFVILPA
jgi:hypothetical protein